MPRPTKKRRTVADSSDDEEPISRESKTTQLTSSSTLGAHTTSSDRASRSRTLKAEPKPQRSSRSSATSNVPRVAVALPPRGQYSPKNPKKLTGQYKALHSYFGVPVPKAPISPGSDKQTSTRNGWKTTAFQNEDADDLIEDVSDDELPTMRPTGTTTRKDLASKPGASEDEKGSLSKSSAAPFIPSVKITRLAPTLSTGLKKPTGRVHMI